MIHLLTCLARRDSQRRPWLAFALAALLWLPATPVAAQAPAQEQAVTDPAVAAEPPEAPEEEALPALSRQERDDQLLAAASPEEVRWLGEPEEKILALFRPTETRETKGALLILHATEVPPGWPASLENLRRNLPQYGWVTVAVAVPPLAQASIPKRETPEPPVEVPEREDPAENQPPAESTSTAATEPISTRSETIARRAAAAAAFLREQGQLNTVLLVDNSSILDALTGLQSENEAIQALLLANLQPQEPLTTAQLEGVFSSTALPVLDIFITPNTPQQQPIRQQHRAAAQRNKLEQYHQLSLPPPGSADINNARNFWLERIRGFIEQHARGKEIKRSEDQ